MIAVPKRVHRQFCVFGYVQRSVTAVAFPPIYHVVNRIIEGYVTRVNANGCRIFVDGCGGFGKEHEGYDDGRILLQNACFDSGGSHSIVDSKCDSVIAVASDYRVHRHGRSEISVCNVRSPVGLNMFILLQVRTPYRIAINVRNRKSDPEFFWHLLFAEFSVYGALFYSVFFFYIVYPHFCVFISAKNIHSFSQPLYINIYILLQYTVYYSPHNLQSQSKCR